MVEDAYENAYVEILEILKYLKEEEKVKIPKEEIDFFEKNKSYSYNYTYDFQNPVILRKTNILIVYLYKKYFSTESINLKIDEMLEMNELRKS